jgi:hypothetical protein
MRRRPVYLATVFLLLSALASVPAFAQKLELGFTSRYDRFKNSTEVDSGFMKVEDIQFDCSFSYDGEVLKKPADFANFAFISQSRDWKFLDRHQAIILADGERFNLGDGTHSGKVSLGGVREIMVYSVPRRDLLKIGNAKQVEIQIGNEQFTMNAEHLGAMRGLARMMIPQSE